MFTLSDPRFQTHDPQTHVWNTTDIRSRRAYSHVFLALSFQYLFTFFIYKNTVDYWTALVKLKLHVDKTTKPLIWTVVLIFCLYRRKKVFPMRLFQRFELKLSKKFKQKLYVASGDRNFCFTGHGNELPCIHINQDDYTYTIENEKLSTY